MERDALSSHGVPRMIYEKFFHHSDGYTDYVCRCSGKPAIYNHASNLYTCKYCGDNADIVAIPCSWSSKLFIQEAEACNIGIRRMPEPFVYQINDNEQNEFSRVDSYNNESIRKLLRDEYDVVDDSRSMLDVIEE